MAARRSDEAHRTATPLELFFDLVFVVAIALASSELHHGIAGGHPAEALWGYGTTFFAIWWAWVNFTWFASAYDCDDVPYRLLVFVQISGALILAAGVPSIARGDLLAATVGYVIMRVALVVQWLRAARSDVERRTTALRYAFGVSAVQVGWIALLFFPAGAVPVGFLTLAIGELLVPAWAESASPTPWHPRHIAERYGLFTIIVLGESVLAATGSIQTALASGETVTVLLPTIVGGLLIVYAMWWLYFDEEGEGLLQSIGQAFFWGYAHYFVFAAAAAVGAGLAVFTDAFTGHAEIGLRGAGHAVAIPVATYVMCLWLLRDRPQGRSFTNAPGPAAAVLILATPFTPSPILLAGVLLVGYLTVRLVAHRPQIGSTEDARP
jgi:low temperature requirement protein LtrA